MKLNIKIKNIKGFGDPGFSENLTLEKNKVNLVYAPNGTGKSSLATAFDSLQQGKLQVAEADKHKKNVSSVATMYVNIDDNPRKYMATKQTNQISPILNPFVINARTMGQLSSVLQPDGSTIAHGVMAVRTIVLVPDIPENVLCDYDIGWIRQGFGKKAKALKNLSSEFSTPFKMAQFESFIPVLSKCFRQRINEVIVETIDRINGKEGNVQTLAQHLTGSDFQRINRQPVYREFKEKIIKIHPTNFTTELDFFLFFYQIRKIYHRNPEQFRKAIKRAKYDVFKGKLEKDADLLQSQWKKVQLIESDNSLKAEFPLADELSNGQRDVMILHLLLRTFINNLKPDKVNLLIIDDIFEYLDDANRLVAEYYLSKICNEIKGEVYIMLLTHYPKQYFISSNLLPRKINEITLVPTPELRTTDIKGLVAFRELLHGMHTADADSLYDKMSKYLFHYNPEDCDLEHEINALLTPQIHGVRSYLGRKARFNECLLNELNKYLSSQSSYDPYAVCVALRIISERVIYNQLEDDADKQSFCLEHMTQNKILFCESRGVSIPDTYSFVTALHSAACHLTFNNPTNDEPEFNERGMVYRLKNKVIHDIIAQICKYSEGTPLTIGVLQ